MKTQSWTVTAGLVLTLGLGVAGIGYLLFSSDEGSKRRAGSDKSAQDAAPGADLTKLKPDLAKAQAAVDKAKKRQELLEQSLGKPVADLSIDELKAVLKPDFKDEALFLAAIEHIETKRGRDDYVRLLLGSLGRYPLVPVGEERRQRLIYALGEFLGSERARAVMIERSRRKYPMGDRIAAIAAMERYSSNWVLPYLEAIVKDKSDDPKVVRRAQEALELVGKRSQRK